MFTTKLHVNIITFFCVSIFAVSCSDITAEDEIAMKVEQLIKKMTIEEKVAQITGWWDPNEDTDEGPTTTWAAPLCDRLSDDCILTDCVLTELRKCNDEKGGKQPTLI